MKRVAILALALAVGGATGVLVKRSAAQQKKDDSAGTRSVEGVVRTGADAPIEGAVVQLKDTKTLQVRSFITKQDGTFHFHGLSTNTDYELKADHDGASSGTKTLSVFDSRKSAVINLKIDKK